MSNKQSMKLYTEEQVIKIALQVKDYGYWDNREFTHIELPSDDMAVIALKTISKLNPKLNENEEAFYIAGFVECAKWMRDKIQGGNK